jgi:hypothetical protein
VQRLKANFMLLEYRFVVADAGEQFPLCKPAATLARGERGGNTLRLEADAVCAWELAVALDLALLAQLASEHSLRLHFRPWSRAVGQHGRPS